MTGQSYGCICAMPNPFVLNNKELNHNKICFPWVATLSFFFANVAMRTAQRSEELCCLEVDCEDYHILRPYNTEPRTVVTFNTHK